MVIELAVPKITAQSWDLDNLEEDWVKANRWLGFIQGVLWEHHIFTIDNMRDHNR